MPRRETKGLSSIMSDVREKRARRAENRQPFFVLKLTVGICSAIIIYACYVYIGRLCVPMLKQSPGAMGSRAMGVAFLVVFILFAVMMIWSYVMVVFVPPGFAKDHASPSSQPAPSLPGPIPPSFSALSSPPSPAHTNAAQYIDPNVEETIGIPYERMATVGEWTDDPGLQRNGGVNGQGTEAGKVDGRREGRGVNGKMNGNGNGRAPSPPHVDWEDDGYASDNFEPEHDHDHDHDVEPQRPSAAVVHAPPTDHRNGLTTNGNAHHDTRASRPRGGRGDDAPAVIDDGLLKITGKGHVSPSSASSRDRTSNSKRPTSDRRRRRDSHAQAAGHHAQNGGRQAGGVNGRVIGEGELEKGWRKEDLTRKPSNIAVLLPEYRYCRRCCIVRPPRAHHCRACGTCVLKYDHHCPWIGQCVGARNHKYFLDFVLWAVFFCFWTLSTLIALNVIAGNNSDSDSTIDAQEIVVIGLSGLFGLFTFMMGLTHISLILTNRTTVEHMSMRSMKDRETEVLGRLWSWWQVGAKRRTKKAWDQEWGKIETDGNLWWAGSMRKNWEEVMGPVWWKWLLPIGPTDSGLEYPRNPRFDEFGRWRPRREWPDELR